MCASSCRARVAAQSMATRYFEAVSRPKAVKDAKGKIKAALAAVATWEKSKRWVRPHCASWLWRSCADASVLRVLDYCVRAQ